MSDAILIDDTVAAELLSMTPRQLARLARKGIVPHVLLPDNAIRFRVDDLRRWVEGLRRPSMPDPRPETPSQDPPDDPQKT